jgi:hypothetical protein
VRTRRCDRGRNLQQSHCSVLTGWEGVGTREIREPEDLPINSVIRPSRQKANGEMANPLSQLIWLMRIFIFRHKNVGGVVMGKRNIKEKKTVKELSQDKKPNSISYRLKCTKTANGLSHYLMYGDLPEDKSLV